MTPIQSILSLASHITDRKKKRNPTTVKLKFSIDSDSQKMFTLCILDHVGN